MANPNFFLPKLNIILEERADSRKLKKNVNYKNTNTDIGMSVLNPNNMDRSEISGSLLTGNKQLSWRPSNMGEIKEHGMDDDHETL